MRAGEGETGPRGGDLGAKGGGAHQSSRKDAPTPGPPEPRGCTGPPGAAQKTRPTGAGGPATRADATRGPTAPLPGCPAPHRPALTPLADQQLRRRGRWRRCTPPACGWHTRQTERSARGGVRTGWMEKRGQRHRVRARTWFEGKPHGRAWDVTNRLRRMQPARVGGLLLGALATLAALLSTRSAQTTAHMAAFTTAFVGCVVRAFAAGCDSVGLIWRADSSSRTTVRPWLPSPPCASAPCGLLPLPTPMGAASRCAVPAARRRRPGCSQEPRAAPEAPALVAPPAENDVHYLSGSARCSRLALAGAGRSRGAS